MQHRRLFLVFTSYGVIRFTLEFLREPLSDTYLGLGFYNWLALLLAAVGTYQLQKRRTHPEPITYALAE